MCSDAERRRHGAAPASFDVRVERDEQLAGHTLLVIGGSSGIGFETARRAVAEGAKVIITARDPERVQRAGLQLEGSIAAFDATDFRRLAGFFAALPTPVDHVLVTGPGHRAISLPDFDIDVARRELEAHLLLPLQVAREAVNKVRPGGTLLFMGCTNGRHAIAGRAFVSAITAALSTLAKSLALEIAPIRVNVIAAGLVEAAALPGTLDHPARTRGHLETTLPIRRAVAPGDVAALAIHLMTNTALTGGTFEIDGGHTSSKD
jgi:NAD(P)-dependent dehydrogenase (short-subunit alcohol dehydrogenase family)